MQARQRGRKTGDGGPAGALFRLQREADGEAEGNVLEHLLEEREHVGAEAELAGADPDLQLQFQGKGNVAGLQPDLLDDAGAEEELAGREIDGAARGDDQRIGAELAVGVQRALGADQDEAAEGEGEGDVPRQDQGIEREVTAGEYAGIGADVDVLRRGQAGARQGEEDNDCFFHVPLPGAVNSRRIKLKNQAPPRAGANQCGGACARKEVDEELGAVLVNLQLASNKEKRFRRYFFCKQSDRLSDRV